MMQTAGGCGKQRVAVVSRITCITRWGAGPMALMLWLDWVIDADDCYACCVAMCFYPGFNCMSVDGAA
jgi:hypothetical protein